MAQARDSEPFAEDLPLDGKTFKKTLADAGYSQQALAETLAICCPHEHQDVEVVYRRVKDRTPYNVLVRLFWLGRDVPETTVGAALPGLNVEQLCNVGLLRRRDGAVSSNAKLAPYHHLIMASDFGPEIHHDLPADHVLGVGAASMTLASVTVRRKVKTALDLGAGAGIQSFLAASHAEHVIGTDTNPRAMSFARFNARLNDIQGVEWRHGSLYEPVADEKFDLIVANPPFVISPESRFAFRDGGMPGDTISEQVIRGAGLHLSEGGYACILFNWRHKDQADWQDRPRSWVSASGCDGWLISFRCAEPLAYAADWLGTTVGRNDPEYGRFLDEWMEYYQQMDIRRISAGAMILRRRKARVNWFRGHVLDQGRCLGSAGEQIERIFAAEDLLESLDNDRQLLDQRLVFDEHHLLKHELRVEGHGWAVQNEQLVTSEGIPFSGHVDVYVASLLAGCDGRTTLGRLVEKMAEQLKTDPEKITPGCLAVIRKLLSSGFLNPAKPLNATDKQRP